MIEPCQNTRCVVWTHKQKGHSMKLYTEFMTGYRFENGKVTVVFDHNPLGIVAAPYKLRLKYRAVK